MRNHQDWALARMRRRKGGAAGVWTEKAVRYMQTRAFL